MSLASRSRLFLVSLTYTSGLWLVFPINVHRYVIMNQLEVCLHSGHTVHFCPSLSPRPSFQFSKGVVPRLGKSIADFPCIYSVGILFHFHSNVSLIPMFSFCCWFISMLAFHFIQVVTGASEGIGKGYALEVGILLLFSFMHTDLRIASLSVGQARAECGHHESLSGQTAESG